ncbi:hypothetical protein COLO4_10044 [Corchorus olitorius]|uniref:Uncharacterized protein n=1 Tax=Corchorus olitorius TaxID=93759 RepID=A0A1R3KA70_9ROSI|nr:hypothetical protein COLO4_10044 [Corchorus olitorius]
MEKLANHVRYGAYVFECCQTCKIHLPIRSNKGSVGLKLEFCKSKVVHLSGYSPLGSPGTTWIKSDVLTNPILTMVAEKSGKTPAQVAIRGTSFVHETLNPYKSVEELWGGEI